MIEDYGFLDYFLFLGVPLFDYSGDDLDRENYQKLKHCSQLLQLIRDFLNYVAKNFKHYLLECKLLC